MDCEKCIHKYKAKYILNTGEEWKRMLRNKTAKKITFKQGNQELYLDKIFQHDCQAGHWNYMYLIDHHDDDFPRRKQNVSYLRSMLNDNDLFLDCSVDIAYHSSDSDREFNFSGVKSVRQKGDTLYIYIKEIK